MALALLVFGGAPLGAKTTRRACVQSCGTLLAACDTQYPKPHLRRRCRTAIIRTCRKQGLVTCQVSPSTTTIPTTTTMAGGPTTTSVSTTSTTTTVTLTTTFTTTTINASALSLVETAVGGTPTGIAAAELFLAPGFTTGYANVVIDLDRDGLEPDTDPAHGGDWWVQNFPLVINAGSPTGAVSMPFALGTIVPSGSYDVYASFTASPVASPSLATMVVSSHVPFEMHDVGALQSGTKNGRTAGAGRPAVPRASGGGDPTTAVERLVSRGRSLLGGMAGQAQAAGPTGDLVPNIPGILQDENECAPTAAAQSLLWMAETQGLEGVPPQDLLLDELKRAMNPTWASGPYPGIDFANFVPGKNTVAHDLNLPIVTTSDGSPGSAGTFDFIRAQIEAHADVELRIGYASGGGHMVTVAGWFDDGSSQKLCFKDPLTGGNTIDCYDDVGGVIPLYKYGDDAFIDTAVAESIVTTTTLPCAGSNACGSSCSVPGCGSGLCAGPACSGMSFPALVHDTPICVLANSQISKQCTTDADCPAFASACITFTVPPLQGGYTVHACWAPSCQ